MADLCDNLLTIKGSKQDIAEIRVLLIDPEQDNIFPELTFEFFMPPPDYLDSEEAYKWMFDNWGSSDPLDDEILCDKEDLLEIKFETKLGYPGKVLKRLIEQYPDIDLNCYSFIDSCELLIQISYKNKHFEEKSLDDLSFYEMNLLVKKEVDPD